jgi:glutaredoxin-like protein NrdH
VAATYLLVIIGFLLILFGIFYFKSKQIKEEPIEDVLNRLSQEEQTLYKMALKPENVPNTFIYALTTCNHCKKTREFLDEHNVPYTLIYIDSYPRELYKVLLEKLKIYNPRGSYPTIRLANGQIITGFREQALREALLK